MGFKSFFKKLGKNLGKGVRSGFKTAKGAIGVVYRDGKSAVSWGAKTGVGLFKQFTPAGVVGELASPGGLMLVGVAGLVGILALKFLSK